MFYRFSANPHPHAMFDWLFMSQNKLLYYQIRVGILFPSTEGKYASLQLRPASTSEFLSLGIPIFVQIFFFLFLWCPE